MSSDQKHMMVWYQGRMKEEDKRKSKWRTIYIMVISAKLSFIKSYMHVQDSTVSVQLASLVFIHGFTILFYMQQLTIPFLQF